MISLYVGNEHAIETDESGRVIRNLDGERITVIKFPAGVTMKDMLITTLSALSRHIEPGHSPSWIETDHVGLRAALRDHYQLTLAQTKRPDAWGESKGEEEE